MTFLNPAILWALAAVSIPVIIHIFNLKRTRKIEFSTLMFLKEIQQSKYKKIKLKQLLILLCRIAFIILLVLAFTRPFENGYLGFAGTKAKSTVLILLDDSFSMLSREASASEFDIAKAKINETLNALDDNDEIYFAPVSKLGNESYAPLYKNINDLRDSLSAVKISDVSREMNEILFYAKSLISQSNNANKEILLFTDGQKYLFQNPEINEADLGKINYSIVLTGTRKANNISVDSINIVTRIFEKNKNIKIKAVVHNHNSFDALNKNVILNYTGTTPYREEKVVDIHANSSEEVEFSFVPKVTGYSGGTIEIQQSDLSDDEIPSDNKRYFTVNIPAKEKILLVKGASSNNDYIKLAMSSSEELMKDSSGASINFFDTKEISGAIPINELSAYNCIILNGKENFSKEEAVKLKEYLISGGGVIIYPPENNSSIQNYNEILLRELDLPAVNSAYNITGENKLKFDRIDFDHPVFEGVFRNKDQSGLLSESPEIASGWNLSQGTNSLSLIKLNDGRNFAVEYTIGRGRLLFYSVSPDTKGSDFPLKNIFSPITVRSILYFLSSPIKEALTGKDYYYETGGKEDSLFLSSFNFKNLKLETSSPGIINLRKYINASSNYSISAENNIILQFPANLNKNESLTDKADESEITGYFRNKYKAEVNIVKPNENLQSSIFELRNGKELWRTFLILAFIFFIIEYFLSLSITKNDKLQQIKAK